MHLKDVTAHPPLSRSGYPPTLKIPSLGPDIKPTFNLESAEVISFCHTYAINNYGVQSTVSQHEYNIFSMPEMFELSTKVVTQY